MSDYILDLRKIVGHRPLLQVGASVIVENHRGEILLEKRADNHCWGYVGGSVELYEAVEDTAKRELFEETGLIARELTLFGVFSNCDEVSNVDIVFLCREYEGTLRKQESEVEQLAFFPADSLPQPISLPNRIPLARWLAQKKF